MLPSYEPSWLAVLGTRRKNKIQFNSIHMQNNHEQQKQLVAGVVVNVAHERNLDVV